MTTVAGFPATVRELCPRELRALPVHRHAGIFRVLQNDERRRLRHSLQAGYDEASPIVVWGQTSEIVDGRNRRDLAVELELPAVPVAFVEFSDVEAVTSYVIAANLARRHLDVRERAELAGRLVANGASQRAAAKTAGVSQPTVSRAVAALAGFDSSESPSAESNATERRANPEAAKVRRALTVLTGFVGEPIPEPLLEALTDEEAALLVAVLGVLDREGAPAA